MQTVSIMKTEAAKAIHKPNLVVQFLIFALVFFATSIVSGIFLSVPLVVWLLNNDAFWEACMNYDFEAISGIVSELPSWLIALELGLTVFEIIFPLIYCNKIEKRSLKSMGLYKEKAVSSYLKGLLLGTGLISLTLGITYLLGGAEITLAAEIPVGLILLYFVLYMIQGAAEEVLVRGYLMMSLTNSIKGKHNEFWAVVLSAIVFAALHLGNPGISALAFFNLFLSGIMFGVLVMRTDNLLCSCALHTAWNFVMGNIFGVYVSGMNMNASVLVTTPVGADWISGGEFGLEGGIGTLIVEAIAIVLILVLFPKKEKAELSENE